MLNGFEASCTRNFTDITTDVQINPSHEGEETCASDVSSAFCRKRRVLSAMEP